MNNDELHIMLETLKRKKKFRDLDLDRFQRVLGAAGSEYESFSFDPAPSLMEIKKEGTGAPSSRPVMKDGMVRQLFSMRYALPSLAAAAAAAVIVAVFWFMPFSTHQAGRALCSFSYGDVQLHRGNETLAVNPGTEFLHGDRVVTGNRSLADVVVDDATKIRVRSNTSLMISSILGHAKGRPMNLDVRIGKGTVLFSFKKLGKGDIATVRTPTSVAGVRGTSFGVEVLEDRSVRYEVLEGKVRVRPHADVSEVSTESSSAVQQQVDHVLEQESVTVSSNQVCRIGGDAGDRIVHAVREALKQGTISGATLNVNALQVRPAVSSTEESGTRMLSDVRAISTRENKNIKNTAVIELAVDVFPESAGVRIDGDLRGKGDVAIITAPGIHTIEVSEKGYVPKTIQKRFTPADRSISVRLERDSGRFSFRDWAARASSSMLFTVTHAGMLVNVSRSGKIEAVGKHGVIWKRDLHSHLTAVPSWDRERLYCATGNERITALSLADGRSLWVRKIEGILLFGSAVEPAGDSL
ncbi:MAG TPA: FecR family protein, partial [Spirochaetota bacterium]|nr:FecR family protein [Spirochaetota bacterium]